MILFAPGVCLQSKQGWEAEHHNEDEGHHIESHNDETSEHEHVEEEGQAVHSLGRARGNGHC